MSVEPQELSEFREQWRAEIEQRSRVSHSQKESDLQSTYTVINKDFAPKSKSLGQVASLEISAEVSFSRPRVSQTLSSAIETYRLATQFEQAGDLDEALRLYKSAFRLEPNVDKAYRREERLLEKAADHSENVHTRVIHPGADKLKITRTGSKTRAVAQKCTDTEILVHVLANFPHELDFIPEDETSGTPLRFLPHEIIVLILKTLDPNAIERFALLSRKARVLSLDQCIWRDLVQKTYTPPQIPHGVAIETLAEQYLYDYRRFYIEHPRLRLDGVYIAICHYVRPGMNADNAWVNVCHLITYHRYLRFFADGSVLSLLANEDVDPQVIVPLLKPSLRMKGLFIGNWELEGTTVLIRDLKDPSGGHTRYTFQMTLELKSRPLGRWNKLSLVGYDSVNKENGEAIPVGLKNDRPFWFSKVRSYSYVA